MNNIITTTSITKLLLGGYQVVKTFVFSLFALYNPGANCRHSPTCSVYAKVAIDEYGWGKGGLLALKRLLSCHPFHKD
jgi:putative membrane protein insertion efficiency factor